MAKIKLLHINLLLEQWQLVLPLLVLTVFILKRSTKGAFTVPLKKLSLKHMTEDNVLFYNWYLLGTSQGLYLFKISDGPFLWEFHHSLLWVSIVLAGEA